MISDILGGNRNRNAAKSGFFEIDWVSGLLRHFASFMTVHEGATPPLDVNRGKGPKLIFAYENNGKVIRKLRICINYKKD